MRLRSSRHDRHGAATPVWPPIALQGGWRETIDLYALLALLLACALGGGSSFAEVPSLLYVRPIALVCLLLFALTPAQPAWRTFRAPLVLLALFAGLMAIQLVPLPPAVWTALPGRAPYAELAAAAGIAQPWRPLSLTPDLTMNSLVALIVPAAVLIGFAKLRTDQRRLMLVVLVVLCCVTALVGIAQLAGGRDSSLYLYRRTYPGFPVGLLSNRNHQAILLALLFPALRAWTLMPAPQPNWRRIRQWLALALGLFALPVVLATGSRAGMALTALGIGAAFLLFPSERTGGAPRLWRHRLIVPGALLAAAAALVIAAYVFGRAASIERLFALSADSDLRFQFLPTVLRIVAETFPAGAGFGSFDPVFRQYEPDAILISSYFNHAHNEVLELAIMAGLPGLLLLAAFLLWFGKRIVALVRERAAGDDAAPLARLGACVVAFLLLGSLVDYPLRPPLMSAVFAAGCAWLCTRSGQRSGARGDDGIVSSRGYA